MALLEEVSKPILDRDCTLTRPMSILTSVS
jgi:hypothetical protein